jgi:hypothetical protein
MPRQLKRSKLVRFDIMDFYFDAVVLIDLSIGLFVKQLTPCHPDHTYSSTGGRKGEVYCTGGPTRKEDNCYESKGRG